MRKRGPVWQLQRGSHNTYKSINIPCASQTEEYEPSNQFAICAAYPYETHYGLCVPSSQRVLHHSVPVQNVNTTFDSLDVNQKSHGIM